MKKHDEVIRLDIRITSERNKSDLDTSNTSSLLRAMILDETRVLQQLPNDFTGAWKILLAWKGISQAELHRRTLIPEKTIGNIINGRNIGSIDNVGLMCLAANLPWDMSRYLIDRSGHTLLNTNDDHIWYSFALKHLYCMSLEEIRSFFLDNGIQTYKKFPEINKDTAI